MGLITAITLDDTTGEEIWTYGNEPVDEEKELGTGRHSCGGWITIRNISKTHQVISCRVCNFRLALPKSIQTWGDLLRWCRDR